jgi:predicted phosphodiesterase
MANNRKQNREYRGLLVIGDPHIEGRQPGFRCDDYPTVILEKLRWCLRYASRHRLLPTLLGDVFEKPRDNPTWMIGELIEMMLPLEIIGIYGNHDCAGTTLDEHDSLSILIKAGCLTLVSEERPWIGEMNHRTVMVGGSSYRARVPDRVKLPAKGTLLEQKPLVIWLTHHDIDTPGYDAGRFASYEIENVELLVNGHIHRRLEPVQRGGTLWLTPGNISRRSRADAIRQQVPTALRIDVDASDWSVRDVPLPHQPAHSVFHPATIVHDDPVSGSRFVDGLRELQLRRTESGAGLHQFLEQNLVQFPSEVAAQIRELAKLVTQTKDPHVNT